MPPIVSMISQDRHTLNPAKKFTWGIWEALPFLRPSDMRDDNTLKSGAAPTAEKAALDMAQAFKELAAEAKTSRKADAKK